MKQSLSDEELGSLIKERFSASLMSNTKWVKVMNTLALHGTSISSCCVKLIWDDSVRDFRIGLDSQFQFDYWETAAEGMVSGSPSGWTAYREFEYLEAEFNGATACGDFCFEVKRVGQFELTQQGNFIRIDAYSPK